jgi:hypothetical protein
VAKAAGSSNVVGTSSKRTLDNSDSDSCDENDTLAPKRKKPAPDTDSESDTPLAVDITAYIHVLRPLAPPTVRSRGGKKPEEEYMQRGPFRFTSDITYGEFLDAIAKALPCPSAEYVVASKVTWRPQKPLKAPPLPLGGTVGFSIMVEQTAMKKADARVIILTMPAPTKPTEEKVVSYPIICHSLLVLLAKVSHSSFGPQMKSPLLSSIRISTTRNSILCPQRRNTSSSKRYLVIHYLACL